MWSSPWHVLIVDDDPLTRRLLSRALLAQPDCRVSTAADGAEGLQAYQNLRPDLVLLDLMMPCLSGLEVCVRIRADAEARNVPIIIITAAVDETTIQEAFQAGANDYLAKPLNLAIVQHRLGQVRRAKQVDDSIRRAKREWEATLDVISDLVLVTGPDDRVLRCNRAAAAAFGHAYADLLGTSLAELFYGRPEAAPEFFEVQAGPLQFPALPGWYQLSNYSVALADGQEGAVHVVRDVSLPHELEAARQAAVDLLSRSERLYRLLAENMGDVIWVLNTQRMGFTYVSPSVQRQLHYSIADFLQLSPERLMPPAAWSLTWRKLRQRLQAFAAGDESAAEAIDEMTLFDGAGALVWVEVSTTLLRNDAGELEIVGVSRDIRERKRAEASLAMQAGVLEQLAEAVVVSDDQDRIYFTNRACDTAFGYARGELLGQKVGVLNALAPAENAALLADLHAQMAAHGRWLGEFLNRRKDGSTFTSAASLNVIHVQDHTYWVSVQTDITERKQQEAWLLNTQKLADLGTLAAGVAHELNSPLQVITGVSQSLQRRHQAGRLDPAYLSHNLDVIHRNGWRCAEIVRSLHTYARVSSGSLIPASLNDVVRDTLLLIEHQLRSWSNLTVTTDLAADLPLFACDRNQITQVLINLLTNARDAMLEGGEIRIATGLDAAEGQVWVSVADAGCGIAPELKAKIFDPFFTTKPIGLGTGLGLSIVASIVRAYGGVINVESSVGQGTTFQVRFPIHRPAPAEAGAASGRFDEPAAVLPA